MSHALETSAAGQVAFADSRTDAWHQLGQQLDGAFDAASAMKQAYLGGWNVRKVCMKTETVTYVIDGEEFSEELPVPRQYANVRTNPFTHKPEVLGAVGEHYTAIQNEEHAEFLDALVGESGAHFETAGSLNGGKNVFITMKMPDFMNVAGQDRHDVYLAAFNSHDGNGSFKVIVTPVRVVCANTQAAALKNVVTSFSVRHTKNATASIAEARRVLELSFKASEEFEKEMEKLMNQKFSVKQMDAFMGKLWTPPAKDASRTILTRHEEKLTVVKGLFTGSPTLKGFHGTKYGAYNSVTEYLDHFSPTPSTKDAATVRAERTLTSAPVRETKEKAFALLAS